MAKAQSILNGIGIEHEWSHEKAHVNGNVNNHDHAQVHGTRRNGIRHDAGQHAKQNGHAPEPLSGIAICGMACRLPGGNHNPQQFWEFLVAKGNACCKVPESRYNVDAYYSPTGKLGTVTTRHGYFLDDSIDLGAMDTTFFSMRKEEVGRADPHHRQMLEVAHECFQDAGVTNWKGRSIGCYIGTFGEDWNDMVQKETQHYGTYRGGGHGDFMLPNRINYDMDLRGPSLIVRTACSSTLVALHEACQALSRGDCEAALVGGVNLIMAPYMTTTMTEQGVLSPDGSCKTFSKEANGYGRGEAVNAIFIKSVADALRDGNPIRAVIRATACNSNGSSPAGFSAPRPDAQVALIRRAYEVAGISDLSNTGFVECHGTGTLVGDPRETEAVASVFGGSEDGIFIGSVKPNVGHSEGASGLTSVIKAVLALEHKTVPPNVNFFTPNPEVQWEQGLKVPTEPQPWPVGRHERISVNSFGIGGSNAHVILDSASSFGISKSTSQKETPQLLLFSGSSQESIKKMVSNYDDYLQQCPERLADVAYTLANHREHWGHRSFAVAKASHPLKQSPVVKPTKDVPKLVMVFTGQGAQWPLMGRELLQDSDYSAFRQSIRRMDKYLQSTPFRPDWTIEEELLRPPHLSRLNSAELSQPLCTALQIALVDTMAEMGIRPDAVVGHSSGEIAAAYASGALTARESIIVAFHRGNVSKMQTKTGAMAAVGLGLDEIRQYLRPGVVVACQNSPKNTTISGDMNEIREVVSTIRNSDGDTFARLLKVDKAYHSHHMAEIGPIYHSLIEEEITSQPPAIPFFSSVTGELHNAEIPLGAKYWQTNLESPVLFQGAISCLLQDETVGKHPVLLEVGPHSALAGPIRQIQSLTSKSSTYASLLMRNEDCVETFLGAIGTLYSVKIPMDLKVLIPQGEALNDLPSYPWHHAESHWFESRLSKDWRLRRFPYHDLLGVRVNESTDLNPSWRNMFHVSNTDWIRDHIIVDAIVFPFTAYAAMIGEAVRQITGIKESYHLRHVVASTALVLSESKPIEIITSFRKLPLTDVLDSEWWEFTVASHNGNTWVKHCSGEAKAGPTTPKPGVPRGPLPRKVTVQKCYDTLRRSGQRFGPSFKALHDISSETMVELASAKATNDRPDKDSYHLHPILIDTGMQGLGIAASRGFAVALGFRMLVPTSIDDLVVFRTSSDIDITASAVFNKIGGLVGKSTVVADGQVVMDIKGLRFTPFDDTSRQDSDDLTARVEWGPHLDFQDASSLLRPIAKCNSTDTVLNNLASLCISESLKTVRSTTAELPHLQSYANWIECQSMGNEGSDLNSSRSGQFQHSKVIDGVVELSEEGFASLSQHFETQLLGSPAQTAAQAINTICANLEKILAHGLDPIQILETSGMRTEIDELLRPIDMTSLLNCIAFNNPNMRVLQVGPRSDVMTSDILGSLVAADGRQMFSEYVYADTSVDALDGPKERFKHVQNMKFSAFEISQDLLAQDFGEQKFDLIVTSNLTRGTEQTALHNIRSLLSPTGRVVLVRHSSSAIWMNYVLGALPGWTSEEAHGNDNQSDGHRSRWAEAFAEAGLEALWSIDSENSHRSSAVTVARTKIKHAPSKKVTLLCLDVDHPGPLFDQLVERGYVVESRTISDLPLPPNQDIISVLDANGSFFTTLQADRLETFQTFVKSISTSGVFWVTGLSQVKCTDPQYAQSIGVVRNMRAEALLDFASCEVDDLEKSVGLVVDVFVQFQMRDKSLSFEPEMEYAIVEGTVLIPRIFPFDLQQAQKMEDEDDITVFTTPRPGRLDDLGWFRKARPLLEGNALEVEPYASGLNFKDILVAMGIVDAVKSGYGLEAAGVVSQVGPSVKDLKVGDRVMYIGHGTFASHSIVSEDLCARMPDNLSFEDGATMPCVYTTSIYSLFHVGNLRRGQSLLIHSAAGGIGISSIHLARMVGAEIFATVGSETKADFLMEVFGLPRNRIFNSRDSSFVQDIMRETNGQGVDLALNSLSGELLHATWKCVAKFGCVVEIGKRDFLGNGKLDMHPFLDNRSYSCVDLDQLANMRPEVMKGLLAETVSYFQDGHIQPIRPINVVPAPKIVNAFRTMQQGQHMGKYVIRMRTETGRLEVDTTIEQRQQYAKFDSAAYYLLVGGLGGLGRSVSIAMIERGARRFIYLSRSAGDAKQHQDFLRELDSMGCEATMIPGSVDDYEDVHRAVSAAGGNLKGVMQLSMVLRDQGFPQMSLEEWDAVVAPKVDGTWNLHKATLGESLDFFLLFSSLSGQLGTPGQANYASANTFLDAFVQYRTHLDLPASVIDIGPVQEIGYIARNEKLLQSLEARDLLGNVSQSALLECVEAAITCFAAAPETPLTRGAVFASQRSFTLGIETSVPLSSPENRVLWKKDIRMAIYHNDTADGFESSGSSSDALRAFVSRAKHETDLLKAPETWIYFATEIGKKIFSLLLLPEEDVDITVSLASLGMDSLVAIEVRSWWKQIFGFDMSVLQILDLGAFDSLGKHAADVLLKQLVNEEEE